MHNDKFHDFIKSLLSNEKTCTAKTLLVQIDCKRKIAINKDEINDENKKIFKNFIKNIPRIYEGISYKDLAYKKECWMEEYQAIIIQGIGYALEVWDLVEYDSILGKELERLGMLPMNKGLKL